MMFCCVIIQVENCSVDFFSKRNVRDLRWLKRLPICQETFFANWTDVFFSFLENIVKAFSLTYGRCFGDT